MSQSERKRLPLSMQWRASLILSVFLALCTLPCSASVKQGSVLLHAGVSQNIPSADTAFPDARGLQVELAHEHTIGIRDMGEMQAELNVAKADYNRELELFDEGITSKKALEQSQATYQKKQIDLMARRVTTQIDEAAIYAKHHRSPPFRTPVLTQADVNRVLRQHIPTTGAADIPSAAADQSSSGAQAAAAAANTPAPAAGSVAPMVVPVGIQSHTFARIR